MDIVLTRAMQAFLATLEAPARAEVGDAVVREARVIQALPPGAGRARAVHQRVEAATAPFLALRPEALAAVQCRRGCSHCCRIRVDVTADEAALLSERIRAGTAHPDPARLAIQRTWAAPADFLGKPRAEADCVFLGADGACTVYEDRPSACRALLVASAPELCRDAQGATQVLAVINPYLELVASAALTVQAWEGAAVLWMAAALSSEQTRITSRRSEDPGPAPG